MNAREMFEKLGYEMVQNDSVCIKYKRDKDGGGYTFHLKEKSVDVDTLDDDLTDDDFEAMDKQEKELGWCD